MNKLNKVQFIFCLLATCVLAVLSIITSGIFISEKYPGWVIGISIICTGYFIGIILAALIERYQSKIKNNKMKVYDPKDIYLLTTEINSNYRLIVVTQYYLAIKKQGKFYELFSEVEIEKEEDTHENGFCMQYLNKPYIVKVEPLINYVKKSRKKLSAKLLFSFITKLNIDEHLKDVEDDLKDCSEQEK